VTPSPLATGTITPARPGEGASAVAEPALSPAGTLPPEDLAAVRAVVLAAHPDTIPELVGGETVAALLASVGPAREAFARVAATVRVPAVPAGSSPALAIDPDHLPATEKIKRGLRR